MNRPIIAALALLIVGCAGPLSSGGAPAGLSDDGLTRAERLERLLSTLAADSMEGRRMRDLAPLIERPDVKPFPVRDPLSGAVFRRSWSRRMREIGGSSTSSQSRRATELRHAP